MSCSSPYSWSGCDMENTWDGVDKFDTMMMKKLYCKIRTWQSESLETSLVGTLSTWQYSD